MLDKSDDRVGDYKYTVAVSLKIFQGDMSVGYSTEEGLILIVLQLVIQRYQISMTWYNAML